MLELKTSSKKTDLCLFGPIALPADCVTVRVELDMDDADWLAGQQIGMTATLRPADPTIPLLVLCSPGLTGDLQKARPTDVPQRNEIGLHDQRSLRGATLWVTVTCRKENVPCGLIVTAVGENETLPEKLPAPVAVESAEASKV